MNNSKFLLLLFFISLLMGSIHGQGRLPPLTQADQTRAASNYTKYCALCHAEDRSGNAADHAPSLKSISLLSTMPLNFMVSSIAFGRPGTPMAPYLNEMGGPLNMRDIFTMSVWLKQIEGVKEISLSQDPIVGNAVQGMTLYQKKCAECHGQQAEGLTAPALANPAFLAFATDAYLQYAISEGRDGTLMRPFKSELSAEEMDDLTAYLRSLASGWSPEPQELAAYPEPKDYLLNPKGEDPNFELKNGRYVPMEQVLQAMKSGKKMVLLDTRTSSEWQKAHLPGAVPIPYYVSKEEVDKGLPKDGTWIVAYCGCPHAASDKIINMLREKGYPRTAVIDEGFFKWLAAGHPVRAGSAAQP